MHDYKKLKVWEKSHDLTKLIYELTESFPNTEQFGLVSQLRRASSSIPTNIAEGTGYTSEKQLARFLDISLGSASEVEYLLFLSKDLTFIEKETHDKLESQIKEIKKMLFSLSKSTKSNKAVY